MKNVQKSIDFLVVGFPKCGTTSFDAILRQHSKIGLPIIKETQIYHVAQRHNKINTVDIGRYFENFDIEKVNGLVEPSFYSKANEIYRDFGGDIKIIFMIRNPIAALYSYFRMNLRYVESKSSLTFLRDYETSVSVAVKFDNFIKKTLLQGSYTPFHYYHWIDTFWKYYSKEKVKVVLFEDFCQDTSRSVCEILDFLGLYDEEMNFSYHENLGNKISKGYWCGLINHVSRNILTECRAYPKIYQIYNELLYKNIQKVTLEENNDKIMHSTCNILKKYFHSDIAKLEKEINIDLFQKWNMDG